MNPHLAQRRAQVAGYDFRGIHPRARFGTASDRYAAWIGQIYPESYREKVKARAKKLGAQAFREETVPVESAAEYFRHFSTAELDFTFYRPLLETDGRPTNNLSVLEQYAAYAPAEARFLLKVPQSFFARKLRVGAGGYADNPDFLNAPAYLKRFHEPAVDVLGRRLAGFVFEQEYQKASEAPSAEDNVAELDAFLSRLPDDVQAHLELRSPHLLVPAYFDWLEARGLGFVFSHWTWLPPLREQWKMCGGRFTAKNGEAVARLLTPPKMRYEDAYAAAHPFDRPVPEFAESEWAKRMVLDVTALVFQAETHDTDLDVIVNNRAYGNAPQLAQRIARRVLDEEERRGGATGT